MTILNPVTWAKENVAILVGAIVFGLVSTLLNYFHVNIIFGLGNALAFALGMWAIAAYKALTGNPTDAARRF